jgi:hypothetical protein
MWQETTAPRDFNLAYVGLGSKPTVIGPLALGLLHPSYPTSVLRVGTSRLCRFCCKSLGDFNEQ